MEYSSLTVKQKADYFDIVNQTHLKLTGKVKTDMKRNMKNSWKHDSNIMMIFMKLYESYDVYEKMEDNEKYNEDPYLNSDKKEDYLNQKISFKKYLHHIRFFQEENDELQRKLEDVEQGKGYITDEDHNIKIQETKDVFRQENSSLKDDMIKYKNEAQFLRDKMEHMENTHRSLMETKDNHIKCLEQNLMES
jgi:predicted  nucleic acid-binding Zn-ribbon protein